MSHFRRHKLKGSRGNTPVGTLLESCQNNFHLDEAAMPGVDLNQKDCQGCTGLYWAIIHDNVHNIELLLRNGASLEVGSQLNAFFHAVTFNSLAALEILLAYHPLTDEMEGMTLISYARRLYRAEMIPMLIEASGSTLFQKKAS